VDAPGITARFPGREVEVPLGLEVAQQRVGRVVIERVVERQPHRAALGLVGRVRDLDREFDGVALAQEAGRIGLHHKVFGRHGVVFERAAPQRAIMRETEEPPFRQRLGEGKSHPHHAIGISGQLREKEGGFIEVLAGGDLAELERRRRRV